MDRQSKAVFSATFTYWGEMWVLLKNDEAVKIINCTKSWTLNTIHVIWIFCVTRWEVHIESLNYSYSELDIWKVFFWKWKKWAHHFNCQGGHWSNSSFKWKLEFGKTSVHHCKLDTFPTPKDFLRGEWWYLWMIF